jgi:SAM-dependent methyltransferase
MTREKVAVRDFWDAQACGEVYAVGETLDEQFARQADARYRLESYIRPFARFDGVGKDVLEIGVGMGADHAEWARSRPRRLVGVDLTPRAIDRTRQRLEFDGLESELTVTDAELLPFPDESFDVVYSWGVLHHSPDTQRAFDEARRVLRPGGELRAMIYHRPSIVAIMLWLRYALAKGRPWTSLTEIYATHLESPGTKGYRLSEARELVSGFASSDVRAHISFGDLLEGEAGQRHRGRLLLLARRLWPRPVLRRCHRLGLYVFITARK